MRQRPTDPSRDGRFPTSALRTATDVRIQLQSGQAIQTWFQSNHPYWFGVKLCTDLSEK
jgi:hypothetical protein